MNTQEFDTLVNTLISNHLAASHTEATRMAEEMLGTSKKVNDSFQQRHHYAVKNFSPESSTPTETTATQEITPSSEKKDDLMKQKIQELRKRAINPEPVHVQVDFDTPKDRPSISESYTPSQETSHTQAPEKPLPEQTNQNSSWINDPEQSPENIPEKETSPAPEPVAVEPALTPEEYSARRIAKEMNLSQVMEKNQNTLSSDSLSQETTTELPVEPTTRTQLTSDSTFGGFPEPARDVSSPSLNQDSSSSQFATSHPDQNDFLSLKQEPNENPQVEGNNQTEPSHSNPPTEIQTGWPSSPQAEQEIPSHNPPLSNEQKAFASQEQNEKEDISERTQEIPTEKKESRWTEEEKKLREDVDITKIFNYANK